MAGSIQAFYRAAPAPRRAQPISGFGATVSDSLESRTKSGRIYCRKSLEVHITKTDVAKIKGGVVCHTLAQRSIRHRNPANRRFHARRRQRPPFLLDH
jgi:hypothetical protein